MTIPPKARMKTSQVSNVSFMGVPLKIL